MTCFARTRHPVRRAVPWPALALATFGLTLAAAEANGQAPRLVLEPEDRVLVQRGFVPFRESLRLYACVVGTPAGIHYAYDLESGALLSMWRGPFADVSELWAGRSLNQTAEPAGEERILSGRPALALFPNRLLKYPRSWPDQPAPLYRSHGYELEPDGQPVFLAAFEDLTVRDRIAPDEDGRALVRRLEFGGRLSPWETWLLLGEADEISARPDGSGWTARGAGPGWTIAWPDDSPHQPVIRPQGERQLLAIRIEAEHLDEPVVYTLTW